jgi:hypothetical protein
MAFRTHRGHYEWKVIPLGLTNASYQRLLNSVLKSMLETSVACYIDDILIYSKIIDEHKIHVREVLKLLEKTNL